MTEYLKALCETLLGMYSIITTVIILVIITFRYFSTERSEKTYDSPVVKYLKRILYNRAAIFMLIGIFILSLFSFGPFANISPWSTIFVTFSSTLIAAATLSIIILDGDYRNFLKDFVVSILFEPEKYKNRKDLLSVWEKVTLSLLKNTLPFQNKKAVSIISKKFIEDKKDYHFENVNVNYYFKVVDDKLEVTQETSALLVISPDVSEPMLEHSVKLRKAANGEEAAEPNVTLNLNNETVAVPEGLEPIEDDEGFLYKFKYNLKPYLSDSKIQYERIRKTTQDLVSDPYIASNFTRYIKGCQIQYYTSDGYMVLFDRLGINSSTETKKYPFELPNEVTGISKSGQRRVLCAQHDLLLPGEGYILTVVKAKA